MIGKKYDIAFTEYFKKELNSLKEIEEDGLLVFKDAGFDLTPTGNRFQRQICIKFDVSAIYKHSRESADLKI